MGFIWPSMLLSLLLVPVLVFAYLRLVRRREAAAADLGAFRLSEVGARRALGRRRHVPPAIFLSALTLLLVGLARPTMVLALPHLEGTAILAFDVSTSMLAEDLKPNRLEAARQAASAFVRKQPSTVKVGVVAFSDGALVVQPATNVPEDVLSALDRLQPQGGTSLTEGMFKSLGAIADRQLVLDENLSEEDLLALDIGYFGSAVIVLLSDGDHTSNTDPMTIAQIASNAGVRVFPIGIGSERGTTIEVDGYRVATALNKQLLTDIAQATGGTFYRAEDEAKLADIYDAINLHLEVRGAETEVTALAAVAAMIMMVAGAGLTIVWFGRVP